MNDNYVARGSSDSSSLIKSHCPVKYSVVVLIFWQGWFECPTMLYRNELGSS